MVDFLQTDSLEIFKSDGALWVVWRDDILNAMRD